MTPPNRTFVANIEELLADSEGQSVDELKRELAGQGIDAESILRRVRAQVEVHQTEVRLGWLRDARAALASRKSKVSSRRPSATLTRSQVIQRITEIHEEEKIVVNFRDLEALPDADLASLLDDLEGLEQREDE